MWIFGVLLILFLLYQIKFGRRMALLSKFPSPKKKFLFHNTLEVLNLNLEEIFQKFQAWHKDLGDIFHITLHPFDCGIIMVTDPKIAEAVSLHQPDRSRSIFYESVARWIGTDGFFLLEEQRCKKRMKPISAKLGPKFYERVKKIRLSYEKIFISMFEVSENRKLPCG